MSGLLDLRALFRPIRDSKVRLIFTLSYYCAVICGALAVVAHRNNRDFSALLLAVGAVVILVLTFSVHLWCKAKENDKKRSNTKKGV